MKSAGAWNDQALLHATSARGAVGTECSSRQAVQHSSAATGTHLEVRVPSFLRRWMPRTAPPRVDRLSSALFRSQHGGGVRPRLCCPCRTAELL